MDSMGSSAIDTKPIITKSENLFLALYYKKLHVFFDVPLTATVYELRAVLAEALDGYMDISRARLVRAVGGGTPYSGNLQWRQLDETLSLVANGLLESHPDAHNPCCISLLFDREETPFIDALAPAPPLPPGLTEMPS